MGPLEFYYGTIALIVTLIGLARGYAKELGSTVIVLVSIFLLLLLEERINPTLLDLGEVFFGDDLSEPLFLSLVYQIAFISAVFAGYSGRTINFRGRELPPPRGTLLSILIGAINGYLIAGTLWYIQHLYGYPFSVLGPATPPTTATSEVLIRLLPEFLLPNATLWMVPIAILLLLRVRG